MYLFKCVECGCINAGFQNDNHIAHILEHGYGLRRNHCRRIQCGCHNGTTPRPRILMKVEVI